MKSWPHAPSRQVCGPGLYCVTAGTYCKERLFDTPEKLSLLEDSLLREAEVFGWQIQAWAVFSNHYHFVGIAPEEGAQFQRFLGKVHTHTATELNKLDSAPGRQVWYRFWDTHLTFEKSYLARLAYVHNNPVHHKLVARADQYEWCSAQWFKAKAELAFYETVMGFATDRVNVIDDF